MGSKVAKPEKEEKRKHDPNFEGPIKNRGCTDIICCGIFLGFLVVYAAVSCVAFVYGDPRRLLNPIDSDGNTCGVKNNNGPDFSNKPFLKMFDLTKCTQLTSNVIATGQVACPTTSICVKECPGEPWAGYPDIAIYAAAPDEVLYDKYICDYGISAGSSGFEDPEKLITPQGTSQNTICAPYYFREEPLLKRCVPKLLMEMVDASVAAYTYVNSSGEEVQLGPVSSDGNVEVVTGEMMQQIGTVMEAYYEAQGIAFQILDDLRDSWITMVVFFVIAGVATFLIIVLMRWIAGVVVWVLLIGVHLILAAGVYYCYMKYVELKADENLQEDPNNYSLKANMQYYSGLYQTWFYLGIANAALLGVCLLLTCFLFNRIRMAIRVIQEASMAVRSMVFSLFFPVIPWVVQMLLFGYGILLLVYIASYEGDPRFAIGSNSSNASEVDTSIIGSPCTPNRTTSVSGQTTAETGDCYFQELAGADKIPYVHAFNIFAMLWCVNFVIAVGQCTLAGGFASWYWTRGSPGQLPITSSLLRCFRYHPGSLAFGAFIISVVQMIRIILEYLDRKFKDKDNLPAKIVICMCKCFFWCFEKFIKFINKNAYIMIAIYGKNFCFSAMDAFFLLVRNIVRVAMLNGITAFLLFMCKLCVTAGMGILAFMFFSGEFPALVDYVPDLNYYFLPIIIIVLATYVIATIFFDVYGMAVDTIFLCVLEDLERHDGSPEKPYFMSKSMMAIVGEKNHFKEEN